MKTFFQDLVKHPPVPGRAHGHLPAGILALLVCALALTGCLSRPSLNPQTFSFNSSFNSSLNPPATNSAAGQPVLGLKKLEVAPPFEDRSFVYRTGDFTYARDPYAGFLDSTGDELLAPLRAGLASQGDFSAVVGTGSALKPDTLVEINVSQLYCDFRQPDHAQAVLTMRFTFFAATNGIAVKPLFQKEYTRSLPLSTPTAAALMKGWDQAVTEILGEVLLDFRQAKSG
jgi:cholesterol transport system auxiliary component